MNCVVAFLLLRKHSTSRGVKERAGRRQHITFETAEYVNIDARGQLLTGDHPTDSLFQVLCCG